MLNHASDFFDHYRAVEVNFSFGRHFDDAVTKGKKRIVSTESDTVAR